MSLREHLYCVENTCGSNVWVHAAAQTLWCMLCPPVNAGLNRKLIREQAGVPGSFIHDMGLHACYWPCALAQESRQVYAKGYDGSKELQLPYWRSMFVSLIPLHDLNRRLLKAADAGCIRGHTEFTYTSACLTCLHAQSPSHLLARTRAFSHWHMLMLTHKRAGDLEEAKEVLRLGADPNVRQAESKATPLMFAAHEGHVEICLVLVSCLLPHTRPPKHGQPRRLCASVPSMCHALHASAPSPTCQYARKTQRLIVS